MKKPELLAPAGSVEAFYAAAQAGADAVYLGLRKFNARERARNFTLAQLKSILKEAKELKIKVFVTLNTLIKNSELPELFDLLFTLEKMAVDAIIIQDYGVYYLAEKHFPRLELHASTQMGHHNSQGARLCELLRFQRMIMARELTMSELTEISQNSSIELEVFVHGALCYSFSGMCLFSSFLGGMSANRGNCRQPCRRKYLAEESENYSFNLKDNQQLENVNKLAKLGICSLKIEGRMKPAEYVYTTTTAYRMMLDDHKSARKAEQLLQNDLAREKTAYFLGGQVKDSISNFPYTGTMAGTVQAAQPQLIIKLHSDITTGDRIRILSANGHDSQAFKIKKILLNAQPARSAHSGDIIALPDQNIACQPDDQVFLVNSSHIKFPNKLKYESSAPLFKFSHNRKKQILNDLVIKKSPSQQQLFIRINDLKWLRKLFLDKIDLLILNLDQQQLKNFKLNTPFLKNNANRFIIQLPRFISQKNLPFFHKQIARLISEGISQFVLSHLSQKVFFDSSTKLRLYTSENVYVLNDAAIALMKQQQITNWIYPLENDFPNLISGNDRRGIVPLLFYPELFISRMPLDLPAQGELQDKTKKYFRQLRDGLTIILPEHPVSLLQFHNRLIDKGFRRFLIDFSWFKPSSNTFNRLIKEYADSLPEQPATTFNFKMGLK